MKGPTDLVQHLVTFIQDERLDTAQSEILVSHKRIQSSRSADNDVRMGILVLEDLDVLLHGRAAIKDGRLDFGHVFAETGVFILDLIRQLSSVAHDEN